MRYYKIAYYKPDPSSDLKFTLAVIITNGDDIEVLPAKKIPCDDCLGGTGRKRFAKILIDRLVKTNGSSIGIGPYCIFSAPTPLQPVGYREFVEQIVAGW